MTMKMMCPYLAAMLLVSAQDTAWSATYTIDDCIKSARNGSEICDDAAFVVPQDSDLVLVCLDDNGGMAYVSSNTGPTMEDGVARCQGWEEQGLNAWNHLEYIDSMVCDANQKVVDLNLSPGKKRWMGIHDYPVIGQGHFTMACLAEKKDDAQVEELEEAQLWAAGLTPSSGYGCGATFEVGYGHSQGPETFRIVQLWIGAEVAPGFPAIQATLEHGVFQFAAQHCLPGEDKVLVGPYGSLDCAASSTFDLGDERWVHFAITIHTDTFSGEMGVFLDAKGGEGDPEPRLGWTEMGDFHAVNQPGAPGCAPEPQLEPELEPELEEDTRAGHQDAGQTEPPATWYGPGANPSPGFHVPVDSPGVPFDSPSTVQRPSPDGCAGGGTSPTPWWLNTLVLVGLWSMGTRGSVSVHRPWRG